MNKLFTAISGIGLLCLPSLVRAEPAAPLRTYTQDLVVEFASPEDAQKAALTPTPVFDGKSWAYSARWDDNSANNTPVHQVMVDAGIHGTFYLNESRKLYAADYANDLASGGCDLGGHTQTHRLLNALLPNEVFYELLANRVEREAEIDRPIVTFAFPGGVWRDKSDPLAQQVISQAFLRSGFHNCTYIEFALQNPDIPAGEVSTGHQVSPGDHDVYLPAFYKQVDRIVAQPARYQKDSYCIFMGVHARQTGKQLKYLEDGFRHYAGNADWWYCTMNEYAAYARQVKNTKIEAGPVDGSKRVFHLTRPVAGDLGNDVPLTVEIKNAAITGAHGNGFTADRVAGSDRVLLNLHHSPEAAGPARIDAVVNADNASAPSSAGQAPPLTGWLYCNADKKQLELTIKNTSPSAMQNVSPMLRLPPLYANGVRRLTPLSLEPGQQRVIIEPLGDERPESVFREGRAYFVAEIDAHQAENGLRLYATTRLANEAGTPNIRDAAHMLGPFAEGAVSLDQLQSQSTPGQPLTNLSDAANFQWFTSTAGERLSIKPDRVTLYRNDAAWKNLASPFDVKPQCYLVAFDGSISEPTQLKVSSGADVLGILVDGAAQQPGNTIDLAKAGKHRVVLMVKTNDNRAIWTAFPLVLKLDPAAGVLQYNVVPPTP